MNTAAFIHALAAVTIPAENLVLLLLWVRADVEVILRLQAIGLFVPVVLDVIYRQKERFGLATTRAFVAEKSKQFLVRSRGIFFPVPLFIRDSLRAKTALLFIALPIFSPTLDTGSIRLSASDLPRIVTSNAKHFHEL